MQFSFDPNLIDISEKIEDDERLSFDDGLVLYATNDLNAFGKLADTVRRKHAFSTCPNAFAASAAMKYVSTPFP